jgi:hypothetical protein
LSHDSFRRLGAKLHNLTFIIPYAATGGQPDA